ncbi:MAG: hypothetical protein ACU0CO_17930 [Shimia sp.]
MTRPLALFAALLATLVPVSPAAGPWLRDEGRGFVSAKVVGRGGADRAELFAEWGWRAATTLGVEIGHDMTRSGRIDATLFARRALGERGPWRAAYGLGIGANGDGPNARVAVHVGRGLPQGWLSFDGSVTVPVSGGETMTKLDATLGRRFGDGDWAGILQVYQSHTKAMGHAYTVAPAVTRKLGDRLVAEIGLRLPEGRAEDAALVVGLWTEF